MISQAVSLCPALQDAWRRFQAGDTSYQDLGRESSDPGWMLPLRLLSEVYTTHMATSGQLEMYESQKPLPLLELFDPKHPGEGLVSLLKHALFQVQPTLSTAILHEVQAMTTKSFSQALLAEWT